MQLWQVWGYIDLKIGLGANSVNSTNEVNTFFKDMSPNNAKSQCLVLYSETITKPFLFYKQCLDQLVQ